MKVLSVATHSERWFAAFVESCRRHHLELQLLGWEQAWRGFSWRFDLYKAYLAELPANEIVLITDAFDSLVLADAAEIEARFRAHGTPILYSCEPRSWRLLEGIKWLLFRTDYRGYIVNGGTYIGYAAALLEMMETLEYRDDTDDQALLTQLCARTNAAADFQCAFFLHWTDMYPSPSLSSAYARHERLFTSPDDGKSWGCPVLLSAPGGSNPPRRLLTKLGYDEQLVPTVSMRERLQKTLLYLGYVWRPLLGCVALGAGAGLYFFGA